MFRRRKVVDVIVLTIVLIAEMIPVNRENGQ